MPKIRGVKPDLWTDENFVELSAYARLLWIGLWNYACDNGHVQDKSKQIKMRVLPTDDVNCAELLREIEGQRLIPAYQWHVRRAGKGGVRVYAAGEFDMLALVALDIRRIAYLPPSSKLQTVHIRPPGARGGRQFDDFTFGRAIEEFAA